MAGVGSLGQHHARIYSTLPGAELAGIHRALVAARAVHADLTLQIIEAKDSRNFWTDGTNDKIWIQDRKTGAVAGSIGDNGRMAGYFHWIDAIAMDSRGNLYTGEVDTGKRVQKFVLTNGDGVRRFHPHE